MTVWLCVVALAVTALPHTQLGVRLLALAKMSLVPIGMRAVVKAKVRETLHSVVETVVAETSALAKAKTQCQTLAAVAVAVSATPAVLVL
jgi:hypothetical protein